MCDKCRLSNTLVVGVCEAIESGCYETWLEIPREEAPELTTNDLAEVLQYVVDDARVESVHAREDDDCFRFIIRLFADAAQIHQQAVEQGLIEPGLVLERSDERSARRRTVPDWENLPGCWLN